MCVCVCTVCVCVRMYAHVNHAIACASQYGCVRICMHGCMFVCMKMLRATQCDLKECEGDDRGLWSFQGAESAAWNSNRSFQALQTRLNIGLEDLSNRIMTAQRKVDEPKGMESPAQSRDSEILEILCQLKNFQIQVTSCVWREVRGTVMNKMAATRQKAPPATLPAPTCCRSLRRSHHPRSLLDNGHSCNRDRRPSICHRCSVGCPTRP